MAEIIRMDPQQWSRYMGELAQRFQPAMQRGIVAGAQKCIPILQAATRNAPPASDNGTRGAFDTGIYLSAWRATPISNGAMVFNSRPQAGVIDYGRRPSPVGRDGIRNLTAWAHRKLQLSDAEARSAAWAIAKTLEKRPLKARKVMTGSEAKMIEAVESEITHELDVELNR